MTDKEENSDEIAASQSFDVRFLQKGKHSVVLFLPQEFHALIGLIIAYWGNFEVVFDSCLNGLIEGEKLDGRERETSGWEKRSFKKRRKLFRNICDDWLSEWKPEEAKKIIPILESASHLRSRRDVIAHGTYGYIMPSYSSTATDFYAKNNSTGEKMPFDERILKKLYHDISHVTADLIFTFQSIGKVKGPFYAIPDADLLRIYRETEHPWNPNPRKRPDGI